MIYIFSLLILLLIFSYGTFSKVQEKRFPMKALLHQLLADPQAYNRNAEEKPFLCLQGPSAIQQIQMSEDLFSMEALISGCRTQTTHPHGLCYVDECPPTLRTEYHVVLNRTSILDISLNIVPMVATSVRDISSDELFKAALKKPFIYENSYFCTMDATIPPVFVQGRYSYIVSSGCIVKKSTKTSKCNCGTASSSYQIYINNDFQIDYLAKIDAKPLETILTSTLGNKEQYSILPQQQWENFYYACYTNQNVVRTMRCYSNTEIGLIYEVYAFDGCRYLMAPADKAQCNFPYDVPERMQLLLSYDVNSKKRTLKNLQMGEKYDFSCNSESIRD